MNRDDDPEDNETAFNPEKCPFCRSVNIDQGYGMAGGGMGVYTYCKDCGGVFNKVQTD